MKRLFFLLLLLLTSVVQAQQLPFQFDHVTVKDGLSQSQAYCFFQDSYGYLWIGTQDGLNRYNGSSFKVYKNDPFDSTTITHNWIWSITEDRHGDLWLGTFQGLCKYIRSEDKFVQYHHKLNDTTSISGNRTNFVLRDNKDRIWISVWGAGLNLYDEATNQFKQFPPSATDKTKLGDPAIRVLHCDKKGTIWVGTWTGGLYRIHESHNQFTFERIPDQEGLFRQITSITEDQAGKLWIGSYTSGLVSLDPKTLYMKREFNFGDNEVNKLLIDSKSNLWIGTNSGLYYIDSKTNKVNHYQYQPFIAHGISSNTLYELYEDKSGNIWIAANGLDLYNPRKRVFQTFRPNPESKNNLSDDHINTFCEDNEGNIWIGTETGSLNEFNTKTKTFTEIKLTDKKGAVATNLYQIAFDGKYLWLASFQSGLIRYDKKTGSSYFFLNNHPSPLGKEAFVNNVLLDFDGTIWIGTYDNGLYHYDPKTDKVSSFKASLQNTNAIGANFINRLYLDKKNNLWIGLWGGGLSLFIRDKGTFINYRYDRNNKSGLSDQAVSGIIQHDDSTYFICTQTGINKLNRNTGKFTHYFEKDGLASNVTYDILPDNQGHYWITTNEGLIHFNPVNNTFKTYSETDGLAANEFNHRAVLASTSGYFYVGTIAGFSRFNPSDFKENKTPPILVIESYEVFDKTFPASGNIQLPYDENYLTFHFSAIDFSSPEKIRYQYKLEGIDKDWQESGTSREAHYTNLDPGTYYFRVRAANADGYWTEPGATMKLHIAPPFWKTVWFLTLIILVISSIIYAAHRYRLQQSLKVERLRNKIASDLHDEVGSSLTRISIYADLIQNETADLESKNYLKGISALSREVVTTMSDIVWSIDNRYDTLEALLLRMKDFATEILQSKNIELHFQTSGLQPGKVLDPGLKQNLYLIFKEAINNIVKHAQASVVSVLIQENKDGFLMRIEDNGKGLPSTESVRGNGLRSMRRRAVAIEGELEFLVSDGTTISVKRKNL